MWCREPDDIGAPSTNHPEQGGEERGQHEGCRYPTQEHPRPSSSAVDDIAAARARSTLHEVRLRRLTPERQGRQGLGAEVDRENLHHGERQRELPTRQRVEEEGDPSGVACAKMYTMNLRTLS